MFRFNSILISVFITADRAYMLPYKAPTIDTHWLNMNSLAQGLMNNGPEGKCRAIVHHGRDQNVNLIDC